jgi:hypothetical protein
MIRGKSAFVLPLLMFAFALALPYPALHAAGETRAQPEFAPMPPPGKKVPIGSEGYLVYGFDKKPKMGIAILRISIFTPDGKRNTSLEVLADSGMPSMRGAHETGDQPCKLSKKGDYLIPVNIVMPGDWEVRLTVKKNGQVVFRGSHRFDV